MAYRLKMKWHKVKEDGYPENLTPIIAVFEFNGILNLFSGTFIAQEHVVRRVIGGNAETDLDEKFVIAWAIPHEASVTELPKGPAELWK
jgi:hypothetical protein